MQNFVAYRKLAYLKNGIDETQYSPEVYDRQEKLELYEQLRNEGCSETTALKVIGVSRATYYRWKNRYKRFGLCGLEVESRKPNKVRTSQWSTSLKKHVYLLRRKYPLFGKYKIAVLLKREYNIEASTSTVGRILKKFVSRGSILPVSFYYGRVKVKRKRIFNKHAQRWRYGMKAKLPGEMIQIDHLVVTVLPGYTVRHFTATCPLTRLTVEQAYSRATSRSATDFLDYMRKEFPFDVKSVQVDGGSEFMAQFEDACEKYGIQLYVLPPRSPQYNGTVERRNGTARYECYSLYDGEPNLARIRNYLKRFMHHYNTFRPHQALQYQTPWQYYQSLGA